MQLPASFIETTRALLGDEQYTAFASALEAEQSVSVRLNEWKTGSGKRETESGKFTKVPWCSSAFYPDGRPTFTFDPLFHAGCYYVQEASSMFVEQALRRYAGDEPLVMLDLCAAPGGKSTHARSLLPEGSLLVANEVIRSRSQILAENLTKWGHPDVVVTNSDPADFRPLKEFFDIILTDVPCSGEGMFRKDPVAVSEWSIGNVDICRQRQRRIISDIWGCLKPGGILIYSTCTYNTKENEENICWIRDEFGAEILPLDVPVEWNVTGNLLAGECFPVYRFLPHNTAGEGFFLAVLRKHGEAERCACVGSASVYELPGGARVEKQRAKGRKSSGKPSVAAGIPKDGLSAVQGWMNAPQEYEFILKDGKVDAFPKHRLPELSALRSSLRIVQAGVEVAEQKGRDWLPCHALAVSSVLAPDAFPREELSYGQAIAYLRKEAVTLSAEAPRGIVLLTYKGVPLGFAKNIGNRANNLYPQEWRIRSGYLPEEVKTLF